MKPDSSIAGSMKPKVPSIACCCEELTVAMRMPTPSVENRYRNDPRAMTENEPRKGTSKIRLPSSRMARMSTRSNTLYGKHFPASSTVGRIGVTRICSRVPISRLRAKPIAVMSAVRVQEQRREHPRQHVDGGFQALIAHHMEDAIRDGEEGTAALLRCQSGQAPTFAPADGVPPRARSWMTPQTGSTFHFPAMIGALGMSLAAAL